MSDLISRQDAIDVFEILADKMSDGGQTVMAQAVAVCKDLRSAGPEWVLESAIDYLHNVGWLQEHDKILTESAEPERKWTTVTKALPCTNTNVLVTVLDDSGDTPWRYTSVGWLTPDSKYWVVDNDLCYGVIAWMPIPEKYLGDIL